MKGVHVFSTLLICLIFHLPDGLPVPVPRGDRKPVPRCGVKVNVSSITPESVQNDEYPAWRSLTVFDSNSFVGISEDGQTLFKLTLEDYQSYHSEYTVMGKGPNQGLMKIEDCGANADSVFARFFLLTTDCVYISNDKLLKYIGSCKDEIRPATTHSRYASITGAIRKIITTKETPIASITYHSGRLFLLMILENRLIIASVQINDSTVTGVEITGANNGFQTRLFFEAGDTAVYFTLWREPGHLVTKVPVNATITREINKFDLHANTKVLASIVGMTYWKYDLLILLTNEGTLHAYDPIPPNFQIGVLKHERFSSFGRGANEYDYAVSNYKINQKSEWAHLSCIALNGDKLATLSYNSKGKTFPLWLRLDYDIIIAKPEPDYVGSKLLWFNELNYIRTTEVKACPLSGEVGCITNTWNPNTEGLLDMFDSKYFPKGQESVKITLTNIGRYGKQRSHPYNHTLDKDKRKPLHLDDHNLETEVYFLFDTLSFSVDTAYNSEPINHYIIGCQNANNACPPEHDRRILGDSGLQGYYLTRPDKTLFTYDQIDTDKYPLSKEYPYFTYWFDLLTHGFLLNERYDLSVIAVSDNYYTTIGRKNNIVPVRYVTDFQFIIHDETSFTANVTMNKAFRGTGWHICHFAMTIDGIIGAYQFYGRSCSCKNDTNLCTLSLPLKDGETFSEFVAYKVTLFIYNFPSTVYHFQQKYYLVQKDKPTIEVQDAVPDSETEERVTAETNVEASSFGIIVTVIVISLLLVCGLGNFYIYHQGILWCKPEHKRQQSLQKKKSKGRKVEKATKEVRNHPSVQQIHPLNVAEEEYYQKNVYDIYNTKFGPILPAVAAHEAHRGIGESGLKKERTGKKKRSAGTGGRDEEMHLKQVFGFGKKVSDVREAAGMPVPGNIASSRPKYEGAYFDEGTAYYGTRKDIAKYS